MPFGFGHSNRSKQALNDSASQTGTGTPTGGSGSPASPNPNFAASVELLEANQPQAYSHHQHRDLQQQQPYLAQTGGPVPDTDPRIQQRPGDFPSRSQSTRHPAASQYQPAPVLAQASGSSDDLGLNSSRHLQQQQQHQGGARTSQAPVAEPHKKKESLFSRMRSRESRNLEPKQPPPAQSSYNNTTGLNRRLSKRSENPPVIRTLQQRSSLEQQHWQSAQDSRTHLPSPQEGHEDDGFDPYLVKDSDQEYRGNTLVESHHHTIRTVRSDTDQVAYSQEDEARQQFEAQQQHLREQLHHQQQVQGQPGAQNHYQLQGQELQPQVNISPTSLLVGDPQSYRQPNPETVSQISYDSPVDPREETQHPDIVQPANGQSPTSHPVPRQDYPNRTSSIPAGPRPTSQYSQMPPPTGSSAGRRVGEAKQGPPGLVSSESREGAPPNYSRGQFPNTQPPTPGLSPLPPAGAPPGSNYRGGPPQRDQHGATGAGEQGRSTPPPAPSERDVNDAYRELLTKYKKVKGLYFEKTSQVEQLQNTLANQRLSQSRTSLDDSEYMTRFQRLDGATTNLAFNIRKDWRTVPPWLSQYVNQDAMKIGKQEMTAVGRACITKFLVDEIFSRSFHPGLEGELSASLKNIEQNIRRFSPALNNQEESDALTAKVVQWRLATLEGLKDVLSSPDSEEYKKQFSRVATTNLTASLINFLAEPVPPGIEDSAHMIVELAVSIASNLPLESRDISIMYPMPGDMLHPAMMKVETGIPALENPGADTGFDADSASTNSGEKDDGSKDEKSEGGKLRKEKTKSTMLQAMMGGSGASNKKNPQLETSNEGKKLSAEDGAQKVRFAGFVGVEVRGRQVLAKAPVWSVS